MKLFKKIVAAFLLTFILILVGGFIYFDQKFTPEENYLTIKNESGKIPISWLGNNKNALLLPVHFRGNPETYWMQFDTGSPYTLFYSEAIKSLKEISADNGKVKASFYIGNTEISSANFKTFKNEKNENDSVKIIGTIGADVLEDRKTIINFKENNVVLNLSNDPEIFKNNLSDFTFKKRKIIIPAFLKGKKEKFLYDSGTSAYELLTAKEIWENLKMNNSKITIEKSQSWKNILTAYTAKSSLQIKFQNKEIPLNNVTYVEGFSQTQYLLMKFSGMTGMLGNKIFLKNNIYIDALHHKIGIN